ncbi:MAG: 4a-hydroxytetrahydrobiopterin dehydratase [Nitrososphaerota archaeon]|nr:4a-hydroxytetrahydrobiopterin dehydratase [Nitrososphaerota archaeon]MDG7023867.1 4a-hydroxytetrahydrobiopterin dehydratase [Nitrososphaerota archaeon]
MRCQFAKIKAKAHQREGVPRLLSDPEISTRLRPLKGWRHKGAFIEKTFEFTTFMEGIAFIGKVARVAETEEHHPDIHVRYTAVTLSVQTHSEGGVTEWDLELAEAIEKMLTGRAKTKGGRKG